MHRLIFVVGLVISVPACGSNTPTTPSPPPTAQIGGVWRGTARLTSSTGGECLAAVFQSAIGSTSSFAASLNQAGSSLTATVTDPSTGGSCVYTGSVGSSAVTLNVNGCTASNLFGVRCANGAARDLILVTGSINGTVSGNSISGTEAETYNVVSSLTGAGVGTLILNSSFTGTRQ
jgi:hypothetical protein